MKIIYFKVFWYLFYILIENSETVELVPLNCNDIITIIIIFFFGAFIIIITATNITTPTHRIEMMYIEVNFINVTFVVITTIVVSTSSLLFPPVT